MILVVCTGNVCRSPFAERWLLKRFAEAGLGDVAVLSRGVQAMEGRPMDPDTVQVAEELGVDCSGHEGHRLDLTDVVNSQLVLTATRAQRRDVVQLHPPAVQYTFALRQIGRLLTPSHDRARLPAPASEMDVIASLRRFAAAQRGRTSTRGGVVEDDVVDPHGRPLDLHRLAVEQMLPSLEQVAESVVELRDRLMR